MNIQSKIKQYGWKNSLKRLLKAFLRKVGIQYETFWFMVNHLDHNEIKTKMRKNDYSDVKSLTLDDFSKGDQTFFNKKKIELFKSRFKGGKYWAYGIIEDTKLVYSCWITTDKINFPDRFSENISLRSNEGSLEDAYCHPDYRGKGYHSKMNLYRILSLNQKERNKIFAIVLTENIPAIKSQLRSGFVKSKKVSFLTLFGKQYYFENKVK